MYKDEINISGEMRRRGNKKRLGKDEFEVVKDPLQ